MLDSRYGPLHVTTEPGLAVVTIDHPPTNLVDGAFLGALVDLLDAIDADIDAIDADAETDAALRAVVFVSADPDFFLMHGDVEAIVRIPTGAHQQVTEPNAAAATFQRLATAPLLTIGLIDGAARGGGCEFLSALDLRYGTPRAVIGQPEVPMGILPGAGGTARLPRLLGRDHALELVLTGRDVDATEALSLGWLTALHPADEIELAVMGLARRVAQMPAAAVAATKRVVDVSLGDLTAALTAESEAFGALTAAGTHVGPMQRFLAAGGQTRAAERDPAEMRLVVEAMLDHH